MASAEQTNAIDKLTQMLPEGSTVYTLVRSVSQSGMSRRISFFAIEDNKLIDLDWLMIRAGLGKRRANKEGLYVEGCGMDMCFAMVYDLSTTIHNDGYAISKSDI